MYLLRFARLQLRNDAWADDAVSETLLAALSNPQSFGNRSQLKTWLVGILKHKVVDILRKQVREVLWVGDGDENEGGVPCEWGNPHESLGQQKVFAVLNACIERLPPAQGRLFLMREWLELSSVEVCKELAMTPTNLYVQLHRARLRLQECLNINWFGLKTGPLN